MFTSDPPSLFIDSMDRFNKALWGIHTGEESGLIELAGHLNIQISPYIDGLCNTWENISFTDIKKLITEKKCDSKDLMRNSKVMSLEIKRLVMGFELKQEVKGVILVYLFDEGKGSQLSETCKLPFTTDKLGRIPKIEPLLLKDLKLSSLRPNVFLTFRILIAVPINEQKKTTTPIYKLGYWGCVNVLEEWKSINHQIKSSSSLVLVTFNTGDKVNFSFKRYSRLHQFSKQQFLTYKLNFLSLEDTKHNTWIPVNNIGEILRSPPLVESKLYLTLQSGWFEKGRKKSEKNVEVVISIVDDNDEVMSKALLEGREKKPSYKSSVTRHCNTPHWNEMVTIEMPDSAYKRCFVKFECTHITSSDLAHRTSLKWITYLPLVTQTGNVIPNDRYCLRLLPKNTYISKDLWDEEVHLKDESVQAAKYTQRISVLTHLDSTTLTDTTAIYKIKSWNVYSRDLKAILADLNRADFSKCVDHCQQIFASILEIVDSCADGAIITNAMAVLFSFNKFWNTNDDFKDRLLDALARVNFVSGLLKFVSWIKLAIKNQMTSQFNQTIKSLSLLLTIMSKSFLKIKNTRVMAEAEVDRYKVVLANLLVEISQVDVGTNVVLCSQIIKVFPESLRVLYEDGIISISEFSFHMVSIMKGSTLTALKDSAATRTSYIDHLKFIVNSDFMKNRDLQVRYFTDLIGGLTIQPSYTEFNVEKLAIIAVKLSEITMDVISRNSRFHKDIVKLIQDYLSKLAASPTMIECVEGRMTFLCLIAALHDVLMVSEDTLAEESLQCFEGLVKLAKRAIQVSKETETAPLKTEEAQMINVVTLCKKISLASKILTHCEEIGNIALISDMVYVSATLLAEPVPNICQSNAPIIVMVTRLQILQEQVRKLVEKNLRHLCGAGHFEASLIDPVVAMGTKKTSMDWLIGFINVFLGQFPDRQQEILLSLHNHKLNLSKNDFMLFQESQDLSKTVKRQMKLLQSATTVSDKNRIFDIEKVENLVGLINFYSKHKCWVPFKEIAKIYRELLTRSTAFVEAAELTEYCCGLMPEDKVTEVEEDLFTAASYYTEAGLWFRSLEVFKTLQSKYENLKTKDSYKNLSKISEKCKELYENLAEKPIIPFHYFLVGFYGREVDKAFQNKLYIFRGNPLESIIDFTKRIKLNFPQFEQINSAKLPTPEEIAKYIKAFQVIKVNPIIEESKTEKESNLKFRKFSFELCSVKDKSVKNELLRMNYQRFTFEINVGLPSFTPFCELSSFKCVDVSPIEMALEQIKKKSEDLLIEARKFSTEEGNINQFQMMLNGTIDAAVNGGTAKLQETFLNGEYEKENPEFVALCSELKSEIEKQKVITTECLEVHDKVCPPDLRMLHEKMVSQHENRIFEDDSFNEDPVLVESSISPTTAPQRKALINEIARRGSKLKKSTKMNRVKSVFFEGQRKQTVSIAIPHTKSEAVIVTAPKETACNIDSKEFETTYSRLCTELNYDFNLHMLPRYSVGRRETMSMSKPINSDKTIKSSERILHRKISKENAGINYSCAKDLIKEQSPSAGASDIIPVLPPKVKSDTLNTNADEQPPMLPPKSRKSKKKAMSPQNLGSSSPTTIPASLELESPSPTKIPTSLNLENSSFESGKSTKDLKTTSPTMMNRNIASEESVSFTRSYTIERSTNIQSPPSKTISLQPSSLTTPDALNLDLKSLATSFSLSDDSQAKRKISKDDFDAMMKKNPSLNELKSFSVDES